MQAVSRHSPALSGRNSVASSNAPCPGCEICTLATELAEERAENERLRSLLCEVEPYIHMRHEHAEKDLRERIKEAMADAQ